MLHLGLALATAFATACSDDGTDDDAGTGDAGVVDTGVTDSGEPPPDAGTPDTGVRPDAGTEDSGVGDAGLFCASPNGIVVEGEAVSVDDPTAVPQPAQGGAVLSCINDPPRDDPAFITDFCITECLELFGRTPTPAEIAEIDVAAFLATSDTGEPIDPSFDPATGIDATPGARLDIGFRIIETDAQTCASRYQIEMGFLDLGDASFASETRYTLRVRSSTVSGTWATLYDMNFIRRNDQVPQVSLCGSVEARIPSRDFTFPIVHRDVLEDAITAAGVNVPGSDSLIDGRGNGYAMLETRDCAGGAGVRISHVTAGLSPEPLAELYANENLDFMTALSETTVSGLYLATGFTGTSSATTEPIDARAAVGVIRSPGACTEEFGGFRLRIFPDSISFLRTNRETVLHGR